MSEDAGLVMTIAMYEEQTVDTGAELAAQLGQAVWIPSEWPPDVGIPTMAIMNPPEVTGDRGGSRPGVAYRVRSSGGGGQLLLLGIQGISGRTVAPTIRPLEGERFETWGTTDGESPHLVVRAPGFDVHILGIGSIGYQTALRVARMLKEVTPPTDGRGAAV